MEKSEDIHITATTKKMKAEKRRGYMTGFKCLEGYYRIRLRLIFKSHT